MEEYDRVSGRQCGVMRQINITMKLAYHILSEGKRPFREAVEMCCRLREFVIEHCPEQPALFDSRFAPRLREIIHRVYD